MKRKVFLIIGLFAFAAIVAFNVNLSSSEESISDLTLANVEALASSEGGGGLTLNCWQTISSDGGILTHKTYCGECKAKLCEKWDDPSTCN